VTYEDAQNRIRVKRPLPPPSPCSCSSSRAAWRRSSWRTRTSLIAERKGKKFALERQIRKSLPSKAPTCARDPFSRTIYPLLFCPSPPRELDEGGHERGRGEKRPLIFVERDFSAPSQRAKVLRGARFFPPALFTVSPSVFSSPPSAPPRPPGRARKPTAPSGGPSGGGLRGVPWSCRPEEFSLQSGIELLREQLEREMIAKGAACALQKDPWPPFFSSRRHHIFPRDELAFRGRKHGKTFRRLTAEKRERATPDGSGTGGADDVSFGQLLSQGHICIRATFKREGGNHVALCCVSASESESASDRNGNNGPSALLRE